MPQKRPKVEKPKVQAMTRLGTGATLLAGVDGRTGPARRYRELVYTMAEDLGGDLPTAKQAVVNRAASLITWCEQREAEFAQTGDLDIATFTTATNTLRRLLSDIGLDRTVRNITPTLEEYLQEREGKA